MNQNQLYYHKKEERVMELKLKGEITIGEEQLEEIKKTTSKRNSKRNDGR